MKFLNRSLILMAVMTSLVGTSASAATAVTPQGGSSGTGEGLSSNCAPNSDKSTARTPTVPGAAVQKEVDAGVAGEQAPPIKK